MLHRSVTGHGYARLSSAGTAVYLSPDEGGLLFVDLSFREEWDQVVAALRSLTPSLLGTTSKLVFRTPRVAWMGPIDGIDPDDERRTVTDVPSGWPSEVEELAEELTQALSNHHLPRTSVAAVELPIGAAPLYAGISAAELALCRAVELEAFLESQGGLWRPSEYHYQLPSGKHARSFVRVADALRDPAAPRALSSWLRPLLKPAIAVVLDTGSVMPIINELERLTQLAGSKLPLVNGLVLVEAIDRYPRTRFELQRRLSAWGPIDVMALLSVSSSGRTYRLLAQTLSDTTDSWMAECMVDRGHSQAVEIPPPTEHGKRDPWLAIEPLEDDDDPSGSCPSCRNPQQARVVHIDPRTFAAMALPGPSLVMPDYFSAIRNSSLFDAYRAAPERAVHLSGSERSRERARPYLRPDQPERVRFEPTTLLLQRRTPLGQTIKKRLKELHALRTSDNSKPFIERALKQITDSKPTIAVCDEEEVRVLASRLRVLEARQKGKSIEDVDDQTREAKARFLSVAKGVCPSVRSIVVTDLRNSSGASALVSSLQDHTTPLILVAGLQTGVTLQHLVVAVQEAYLQLKVSPTIVGLVVHAHPVDGEAWASVRNSFGGRSNPRLLALWLTYLPSRSPFADELDLLRLIGDAWYSDARRGVRALVKQRLAWLDPVRRPGQDPPPSPLLSPKPRSLRRTSIYGSLDDRHVIPAVGAALSEKFDQQVLGGAPGWVSVDVPNVLRSYFDGILHAAVIRWITPERAWWGSDNVCESLLSELSGRFASSDDWQVLLPEMLLAAAQGKIPDKGVEFLLAQAQMVMEDSTHQRWPEDVLDHVSLGRMLVEHLWEPAEESAASA